MSIRALIFDLDGTLLDTLQDLADAANAALVAGGFAAHPVDAYRTFVGDGIETLMRRAMPAGTPDALILAGVDRMRTHYSTGWNRRTAPYPGITPLLAALSGYDLPLAVLSNKPHPFTLEMVDYYFAAGTFCAIAGAKPDVPRKPSPDAALSIASAWGLPPSDIAFVGDSNVDVLTAKGAGMFSVGCAWGFRGEAELRAAGVDTMLGQPSHLLDLLKGRAPSSV